MGKNKKQTCSGRGECEEWRMKGKQLQWTDAATPMPSSSFRPAAADLQCGAVACRDPPVAVFMAVSAHRSGSNREAPLVGIHNKQIWNTIAHDIEHCLILLFISL